MLGGRLSLPSLPFSNCSLDEKRIRRRNGADIGLVDLPSMDVEFLVEDYEARVT